MVDTLFNLEGKSYIFRDLDTNMQMDKIIENITIDDKKSNILELKYQGTIPERSRDIISTITKYFIDYQLKNKSKELNHNLDIVDNHIKSTSKDMNREIKKIEKFQEKNNIAVSSNGADIVNALYENRKQFDNLSLQIQGVENFIDNLKRDILSSVILTSVGVDTLSIQKVMDNFISTTDMIRELELQQKNIDKSVTSNSQIAKFINELKDKKDLLNVLLRDFTEEHPQVVKQKQEIDDLINKINTNISINLNKLRKNKEIIKSTILTNINMVKRSLDKRLLLLKKDIKKKESLLHSIPSNRMLSSRLNKSFSFRENIYSVLLNKKIEIEIDKSSLMANTKILEDAYVAEKPDKPKVGLILVVSAVTGMILGIFFIFFREFLNSKIRDIRDIETLTDTPILGKLTTPKHKEFEEQLRTIRTNIQLNIDLDRCNRVLISSINKEEGSLTLSVGLAKSMAQMGKRILLIDLDLREPKLHKLLNQSNKIGISNYILGSSEVSDIFYSINEHLDFIPAGMPQSDAPALLMSSKLKEFMIELKENYDYIIFDAPSIESAVDIKVLLKYSDIMVLGVMANIDEKPSITKFNQMKIDYNITSAGIVIFNK